MNQAPVIYLMNHLTSWLVALLAIAAIGLFIPTAMLLVECIAAVLPRRATFWGKASVGSDRPRVGVLMPAHNEAIGIWQTLAQLIPELGKTDLLLVVADNCDDETAAIARSAGATVIERHNLEQRGKGYALDFGIRFMAAAAPPDVVVIVDADCLVQPGAIAKIADLAAAQNRPVQATYLLAQPPNPQPKDAISALAFTVKNLVRPLGLRRLGMPCLLTGTGMAFPWSIICKTPLASGNIVEDMQLSLDLAIANYPTLFCAEAKVIGALPQQDHAAKSQRTRWEHGHLKTITSQVPRLLQAALQQRRLDLLVLALDLLIPPLSLLVLLWLAVTVVALPVSLITGFSIAHLLLLLEGGFILTAIAAAWARFGRSQLPLKTLLSIPLYVLWKVPLYFAFLIKPQTKWVRTERDATDSSNA